MQKINKIPLPICGVILGLAALGNLIQSYSNTARLFCGIIAATLLIFFNIRCALNFDRFKEEMKTPVGASVSGTYSMAVMLLAGYLKPFAGEAALYIWYLGIIMHIALIIYFTLKFVIKLKLAQVFSSWYIVYVGIVVASLTAPVFEAKSLGNIFFYFGLITFGLLLILVTARYIKLKDIPPMAKPLICISTAPASLLIAGYIQSVEPKSHTFLLALWTLATILYVFSLIQTIVLITKPFFPSWASFTFPFVISAIASKQFMAFSKAVNEGKPWLAHIVNAETVIAVVLVIYTLLKFMLFIFKSDKK